MLKVVKEVGDKDIATVYIAKTREQKLIEFVESVQPPIPLSEKWVLIVSTLFGCPVGCPFCDAGGGYNGKLSKEEILAQIDHAVLKRFPDRCVPVKKFKIQFARMGEPALNLAVLEVLEALPALYNAPGLLPSISTVAPDAGRLFFEKLLEIKRGYYSKGNFQFQFSLHTTDQDLRDQIIPIKKLSFEEMALYGNELYQEGDRKITLNFALAKNYPVSAKTLRQYFDPAKFMLKITPINPTIKANLNNIESYFKTGAEGEDSLRILDQLHEAGYETLLSIGELEENQIGSNCGQFVRSFMKDTRFRANREMYSYVEWGVTDG